ncbi:UPF0561 protein C2orf68 homolog [Montipora capricornis]|uniref:UPF0561 protein C2orf68 homolog n=1 Tax=Montipora capricornis TaxID=246305 RepID=UPI0035F2019A
MKPETNHNRGRIALRTYALPADNFSFTIGNIREYCKRDTFDGDTAQGMSISRDSPKLNMEHGFMQSIIKNQVDRDEYDKDQKLQKVQDKISAASRQRTKRPTKQTYVPPHLRAKATNDQQPHGPSPTLEKKESPAENWEDQPSVTSEPAPSEVPVRMKLEFVRKDGEVRELNICEGEDLKKVVNSFGRTNGLDARLRDALYDQISRALKERLS